MNLPDGSCACCSNPGYTMEGRRIQDVNAFRHPREKRVRLYRFRTNPKTAAGRLTLLVCSYCVRGFLNIQDGKAPVFLEETPLEPGETKRIRGYRRKRLVRERRPAEGP